MNNIEILENLIAVVKEHQGDFSSDDIRVLKGINRILNERWITIHPHGEDSDDYRRIKLEDGETPKEAIDRIYKKEGKKEKSEAELKEEKKQLYQDILKAKKEGNKELHHKLLERYYEVDSLLKGDKAPKKENGEQPPEQKQPKEEPKDDKEILKRIEELSDEYKKLDREYWNISYRGNYQEQEKRQEVADKRQKVKEDLDKLGTSLSGVGKTWKNADGETVTFKGYDTDSKGFKVSTTSKYGLSHSYYQNYSTIEQLEKADTQAYEKAQKKLEEKPRELKPNKVGAMPKAKSVKEAEQLAIEYGLSKKVNFGKLSLDICNAMNESANDTLAEFPEIRGMCKEFGSLQGRNKSLIEEAIAIKGESLSVQIRDRLEEQKKIYGEDYFQRNFGDAKKLEKKIAEKVQSRVKDMLRIGKATGEIAHCKYVPPSQSGIVWNEKFKDAKNFDYTVGFHPEGATSLKAICDHEFGHQINRYIETNKEYGSESKYNELMQYYNSLTRDDIKDGLSKYALTNKSEWIAEGWAEYKNNPNCRPMAKKIGELLTAAYKEVANAKRSN